MKKVIKFLLTGNYFWLLIVIPSISSIFYVEGNIEYNPAIWKILLSIVSLIMFTISSYLSWNNKNRLE